MWALPRRRSFLVLAVCVDQYTGKRCVHCETGINDISHSMWRNPLGVAYSLDANSPRAVGGAEWWAIVGEREREWGWKGNVCCIMTCDDGDTRRPRRAPEECFYQSSRSRQLFSCRCSAASTTDGRRDRGSLRPDSATSTRLNWVKSTYTEP